MPGKLYVVATPIGNLADFSYRAVEILQQVDLIAAEDTRHVKPLLQHYGISCRVISFHQHNETKMASELVEKMQQGLSIALVSDAGTPLLSDPGLPLVKLAKEQQIDVSPIPGASALIAALSASGLPTSRFIFEGFVPRTRSARHSFFKEKTAETSTWVFYESSHRIQSALEDLLDSLPGDTEIVIARELTKLHETIIKDKLIHVVERVKNDANMRKGEFVVIVQGTRIDKKSQDLSEKDKRILAILMTECSIKTAVELATEITGQRKKLLYQTALTMKKADNN